MLDKNLIFKLKEKCEASSEKEFFYGAKVNNAIKDVYLGLCYLEPGESDRKAGPGKGHEEIIYLLDGEIQLNFKENNITIKQGEAFHIPDGELLLLKNLTDKKIYYVIAGGHIIRHSH